MRNLTLGVLIVAGGTLAALPFRRGATPDASRTPTHATGPIDSAFDQPMIQSLVTEDPEQAQKRQINRDLAELIGPSTTSPATRESPSRLRRRDRSPLTFEDLLEPIERPAAVKERLSAVAEVRQQAIDLSSANEVAMTMPSNTMDLTKSGRFESLNPTVPRTRQPSGSSTRQRASGSLASVSRREMLPEPKQRSCETKLTFIERLPKPEPESQPKRQWIQQP